MAKGRIFFVIGVERRSAMVIWFIQMLEVPLIRIEWLGSIIGAAGRRCLCVFRVGQLLSSFARALREIQDPEFLPSDQTRKGEPLL